MRSFADLQHCVQPNMPCSDPSTDDYIIMHSECRATTTVIFYALTWNSSEMQSTVSYSFWHILSLLSCWSCPHFSFFCWNCTHISTFNFNSPLPPWQSAQHLMFASRRSCQESCRLSGRWLTIVFHLLQWLHMDDGVDVVGNKLLAFSMLLQNNISIFSLFLSRLVDERRRARDVPPQSNLAT